MREQIETSFKFGISFRLIAMFALISALAMGSMLSSVFVANSTDGDAAAINLAGSLRMQSWRLASMLAQGQSMPEYLQQLDQDLAAKGLLAVIAAPKLNEQYQKVVQRWQLMRQLYLQQDGRYLVEVHEFVDDIDFLVLLIEQQTQTKLDSLAKIQSLSILATFLAIVWAFVTLRTRVSKPLKRWVEHSRRLLNGDFQARIDYQAKDEYGMLSQMVNQMTQELEKMYTQLEQQVAEKTQLLATKNRRLEMLLHIAQNLTAKPEVVINAFPELVAQFEKEAAIPILHLCINSEFHPAVIAQSNEQMRFVNCETAKEDDEACQRCRDQAGGWQLALISHGTDFGYIQVDEQLDDEQKIMLTILADLMANSLYLNSYGEQQARIALLEERNLIARELHDSLAQALTAQKIHLARLKKSVSECDNNEASLQIVTETQQNLNVAYKHLREIISSFRVSYDYSGLKAALESSISEYRIIAPTEFSLSMDADIKLSANEELHCLYICREALNNVVKHAKATHCQINVTLAEQLCIEISDDGQGITEPDDDQHHYGLNIMRERSAKMGGNLDIEPLHPGCLIRLTFTPKFLTGELS